MQLYEWDTQGTGVAFIDKIDQNLPRWGSAAGIEIFPTPSASPALDKPLHLP